MNKPWETLPLGHYDQCPALGDHPVYGPAGECICDEILAYLDDMWADMQVSLERDERAL